MPDIEQHDIDVREHDIGEHDITATDIDAYLARLGVDRELPSADALDRLHRAHIETVPYETTWIHLGERWTVNRAASLRRIAHRSRGGYCFQLNGALSLLLDRLGYDVTLHVGGVHGPDGADESHMDNHLVLTVHGLPNDDNPGGHWYVDAGLGDALHAPLPLLAGAYAQGGYRFGLATMADGVGDWQFTHDPTGSFSGMVFRSRAVPSIDVFTPRNEVLSTSPESIFVTTLTVQRRHAAGVDILRGLVLRRLHTNASSAASSAATETTLETLDAFFEALAQFGLTLDDVSDQQRAALWQRTLGIHERWLATRPTTTPG